MRVLELKNMFGGVSRRGAARSSLLIRRFSSGFTLIELLIVTVVIVTLMGIVFRLAGAGSGSRAKAVTLSRLQRLENAISGYYAAYGSYPPVPLQGRSRDIRTQVSDLGIQGPASETRPVSYNNNDSDSLSQIDAACRAQPVGVLFPFYGYKGGSNSRETEDNDLQETLSKLLQEEYGNTVKRYRSGFRPLTNLGGLNLDDSDWHSVQCFQFGLLSFLLPRYLFMLEGDTDLYDHTKGNTAKRIGQWAANNQLPSHIGQGTTFDSWEDVQKMLLRNSGSSGAGAFLISNITSQAVCARWMPNFEGIISGGRVFYGVDTGDKDDPYLRVAANGPLVFSHGSWSSGGGSDPYILNGMTVRDGWGNEFYYHSDPPYQSYRLWSAGPNGRTFPPWYDIGSLSASERKLVATWTEDDLMHLAN